MACHIHCSTRRHKTTVINCWQPFRRFRIVKCSAEEFRRTTAEYLASLIIDKGCCSETLDKTSLKLHVVSKPRL